MDKKTILIVDDSELITSLTSALLSEYDTIVAKNGVEALQAAQKLPKPDLILLDIEMPIMDGFEACTNLKKNSNTSDIPVIFLSGNIKSEDKAKGLEYGGMDFLTKPINPADLLVKVKNLLSAL